MSSSTVDNAWAEPLPAGKTLEDLNTYLAILPDFADSKRMSIRPTHIANADAGHKIGWIVKGGATLDGDGGKMTGSFIIMREETLEKARARLERDIYTVGGAWDMSKATITAIKTAVH